MSNQASFPHQFPQDGKHNCIMTSLFIID